MEDQRRKATHSPREFKGFKLDDFQIQAIEAIERNHSVVVSAATGTGKTLIADYVIDKFLHTNARVIYTAPIKALSNQKFKDFRNAYGIERVGILTGDVVVNPRAQILVMTTEIYRNMLMSRDASVLEISYVVFDEIHYISDLERGTVWEESIIFSPANVRFLCLSATIPNHHEFAHWIESIKDHPVEVVRFDERAVPLRHFLYDKVLGLCTAQELKENLSIPDNSRYFAKQSGQKFKRAPPPSHLKLINEIGQNLPAIYFSFSRKDCEKKAQELAKTHNFSNSEQKARIIAYMHDKIPPDIRRLQSVHGLRQVIDKGIAYHHAGLLPILKEIVEHLFGEGLIKLLYCTETFAVGINMPAKTVVFNSLEKYDGITNRYLNSKEYFQLAGRAGRRGMDKEGHAIAIVDRDFLDIDKVIRFTSQDTEPIISRFQLTWNSVLNLVDNHPSEEIDTILKKNFDYYLRKKQNRAIRIGARYRNMYRKLEQWGYIRDRALTDKGRFAKHIFYNEMVYTELFFTNFWIHFTPVQLLVLVAGCVYEDRRQDEFAQAGTRKPYADLLRILERNRFLHQSIDRRALQRMLAIVKPWAEGALFTDVLAKCNYLEGDVIRLFRRIVDSLQQIRRATEDQELANRMSECINLLDRDVVKVEF